MNRRELLRRAGLASAATLVAPFARAIGPDQKLRVAHLRHSGRWDRHRGAAQALAQEVHYRTSIDVADDAVTLSPAQPRMARLPFALVGGDDTFHFTEAERASLKRWLELGGFLVADNQGGPAPSDAFDRSLRRELAAMFPRQELRRVSPEHVLFRSFYRLDYPAGRAIRKPYLEGLKLGRRYAVVLTHNDLLGALAREPGGRFRYVPTPGGENQREMAVRFGVNMAMYGMCLHYKDDQVHLDYLLRRRKWKIKKPDE